MKCLVQSAGVAIVAVFGLLLSSSPAYAASDTQTNSFDTSWGHADVEMTLYRDHVHVAAKNVTSKGGCVKLKYKADRRTTALPRPYIERDSVGDLARTCHKDIFPASGEHDIQLTHYNTWVDHVEFEFCSIQDFWSDDCETIEMKP